MRHTCVLLALLAAQLVLAQLYPHAEIFVDGSVLLHDSTELKGQVMWPRHQNQKFRFRTTAEAEPVKYTAKDLLGFTGDGYRFDVLQEIEVWAENSAVFGKTSRIKQVFAQRLHGGRFTVHVVFISAYDGVSGAIQTYPNLLFRRTDQHGSTPIPYPLGVRMKDGRYERAKEPLLALFQDHPQVVELLRAHQQQDDIGALLDAVKAIDSR